MQLVARLLPGNFSDLFHLFSVFGLYFFNSFICLFVCFWLICFAGAWLSSSPGHLSRVLRQVTISGRNDSRNKEEETNKSSIQAGGLAHV